MGCWPIYRPGMASRRPSLADRLAGLGLERPVGGREVVDGHLHADGDEICPRCLGWIHGRDYVRRTGFGLLQHEVCPVPQV